MPAWTWCFDSMQTTRMFTTLCTHTPNSRTTMRATSVQKATATLGEAPCAQDSLREPCLRSAHWCGSILCRYVHVYQEGGIDLTWWLSWLYADLCSLCVDYGQVGIVRYVSRGMYHVYGHAHVYTCIDFVHSLLVHEMNAFEICNGVSTRALNGLFLPQSDHTTLFSQGIWHLSLFNVRNFKAQAHISMHVCKVYIHTYWWLVRIICYPRPRYSPWMISLPPCWCTLLWDSTKIVPKIWLTVSSPTQQSAIVPNLFWSLCVGVFVCGIFSFRVIGVCKAYVFVCVLWPFHVVSTEWICAHSYVFDFYLLGDILLYTNLCMDMTAFNKSFLCRSVPKCMYTCICTSNDMHT